MQFFIDAYLNTNQIVRCKYLDESYKNKCFICEESKDGNIRNWALECRTTKILRESYLKEIMKIFRAYDVKNGEISFINYIFKGKSNYKYDRAFVKKYDKRIDE